MRPFHFARKTLPAGISASIAHIVANSSEEAHAQLIKNSYENCPPDEWIPTYPAACKVCNKWEDGHYVWVQSHCLRDPSPSGGYCVEGKCDCECSGCWDPN